MKENIEKRVIALFLLMLVILAGVAWLAVNTIERSKANKNMPPTLHSTQGGSLFNTIIKPMAIRKVPRYSGFRTNE